MREADASPFRLQIRFGGVARIAVTSAGALCDPTPEVDQQAPRPVRAAGVHRRRSRALPETASDDTANLGRQKAVLEARGRAQSAKIVIPAPREPLSLSFWHLIECHVLRALRTQHEVPLQAVRKALELAENELQIERLLLHKELQTSGGRLFLHRYGALIELSASGQIALRKVFEQHLQPVVSADPLGGERFVAIDRKLVVGRPIVHRQGTLQLRSPTGLTRVGPWRSSLATTT